MNRARVRRRYTPGEVAKATGLNIETVRRAIRSGELVAGRTGRRGHYYYVEVEALEAWLAKRATYVPGVATNGSGDVE
jgi:excisionase family DNA binding protein